jgi:lactoylglutathione lyase
MKLDHIGVIVKDTDESIAFYTQVLGAKIVDSHARPDLRLTFLEVGGQIIELVQRLGSEYVAREWGPVDHIAFVVEDLVLALEKVKSAGAPILYPEPVRVANKLITFFTGPDGERLEFVEYIKE